MMTMLIIGGNHKKRAEKIDVIIKDYKVSKLDRYNLAPKLSIGIDEIKEFRKWAYLAPYESKIKAGVVCQAEKMTYEAASALLKILEEPPESCFIILEAASDEALLPTVVSRCKIIELPFSEKEWVSEEKEIFEDFLVLLFGGVGKKFELAEKISSDKKNARVWISEIIRVIRKITVDYYVNRKGKNLASLSKKCQKEKVETGKVMEKCVVWLEKLGKLDILIQKNINLRLLLENCFVIEN